MNSSPEDKKSANFWTTIPGILSGLAALIVALTGLIAAILPLFNFSDPYDPYVSDGNVTSENNTKTNLSSQTQPEQPSLNGTWFWEYQSKRVGVVEIQEKNGEYWGEVKYEKPVGAKATLKGKLDGEKYNFVWWFGTNPNGYNNPQGSAFLEFVGDDQTLRGEFTNYEENSDEVFPWELRRNSSF